MRESPVARPVGPMSIWEVLDRSVRLYRRHAGALFVAAALVGTCGYIVRRLSLFGLQAYVQRVSLSNPAAGPVLLLVALAGGHSLVALASGFVETGVLASPVRDAYLRGRIELLASLKSVPLAALVASSLLSALAIMAGGLLLLVPGLFLAVSFALVPVVCALERLGPASSLRRSWTLMRAPVPGGFWNSSTARIVTIWGFAMILELLGFAVLAFAMQLAPDSWKMERIEATPMGQWQLKVLRPWVGVGMDMVRVLVSAFFRPFVLCALVLFYHDIRVRREGFDVELMLERMELQEAGAAREGGRCG